MKVDWADLVWWHKPLIVPTFFPMWVGLIPMVLVSLVIVPSIARRKRKR